MVPASPDHAPAARGASPALHASPARPDATEPSKNVGVPVELGPRAPFACKLRQKTTETWLSRLTEPSRSPSASPTDRERKSQRDGGTKGGAGREGACSCSGVDGRIDLAELPDVTVMSA